MSAFQNQHTLKKINELYEGWFLDYASYVILERAVPLLNDGLKPVQRRILHSMRELEDGRYNKVANLVGNTMKYHPHGDASITDALVQLGQKDLLIDTQGNWGNILTGDGAAAARYIEARLTPFALEVVFNPKTTPWQKSYDGRNLEPIYLPVKFPLLLAQGVEGIAVGLSTKILPHNFNELIDASIAYLRGKTFELFPDFPTGGYVDVSNYNDGQRGGRIRIRAKILQTDKHQLTITEIPYGTTTGSLIDSILKANEKGKIKIKKIEDNTAEKAEINIQLPSDVSPLKTIDALYAFSDCEVTISTNACVIHNNKPEFLGVTEILKRNTDFTVDLLKQELEIQLNELQEQWHFVSLEKIFIENKIYRKIEDEETWEGVLAAIENGLKPFVKILRREVTEEDIIRLTEIKIKRISKFDLQKAEENLEALNQKIKETQQHLAHLTDYAIAYFQQLKKKYGKGRERKAELKTFDVIQATQVAVANEKFYINREDGFVGTALKKDEFLFECSDLDDVIVFRKDGTYKIIKVEPKTFVGKDIIHVGVWKKNDERTVYNAVYRDGKFGPYYMKRFFVTSITRDKEYNLTQGKNSSEVLYFSANPNGEAEKVIVHLRPNPRLKKTQLVVDFSELMIKGRDARGNLITKYPVRKVVFAEEGVSTLDPQKIYFDPSIQRLNTDERGTLLGEFDGDDKILTLNQRGQAKLLPYELTMRFDEDLLLIEKWKETPVWCVYYDGEVEQYYAKRFILSNNAAPQVFFEQNHPKSKIVWVSTDSHAVAKVEVVSKNGKETKSEEVLLNETIPVKGYKAAGKAIHRWKIKKIVMSSYHVEEQFDETENHQIPFESISSETTESTESNEQKSLFD